jgi:O-antigen/teichoic acid export membrane protein
MFALASSVLTLSITARRLGPEGRGVVAAALAWVAVFATALSLSYGQVIIHMASRGRPEVWLPRTVGTVFALAGGLAALGWTAAALAYLVTAGRAFDGISALPLFLAFAALPALLTLEPLLSVFIATDDLTTYNAVTVLGACASLLATVALVLWLDGGVPGALLAVLIAQGAPVVFATTLVVGRYGTASASLATARRLVAGGLKLHLNVLGTLMFTTGIIVVVNHFGDAADTAFYQLATQFLVVMQLIPAAMGTVGYRLVSKLGPDGAWPAQRKLLLQGVGISILLAAGAYVVVPLAVWAVAGREFLPAASLTRWLLLAMPGMAMSSIMASQWIGRGLFVQTGMLTLAVGACALGASILLVQRSGVQGAVWATVLAYGVSVFGNGAMALWIEYRHRVGGPVQAVGVTERA